MSVSAEKFKNVMARVATMVTVVTATGEGGPTGLTVSAFTSVSADPAIVLVCIDKATASVDAMLDAPGYTVNFLPEGTSDEAMLFATHDAEKFGNSSWRHASTPDAGPVLESAFAYLECMTIKRAEVGDHWVIYGEVAALGLGDDGVAPLIWHDRGFAKLAE